MTKIHNKIGKYALLTEIAMMCDELEETKRLLAASRRTVETMGASEAPGALDLKMIEAGRRSVFEESTWASYRRLFTASLDEETNEVRVMAFEDFRNAMTYKVPDFMSRDEFYSYFDDELREAYWDAREVAINELGQQ